MQEVEAMCDRVIIISKGNIVADDTLQNLQKGAGSQYVLVEIRQAIDIGLLKGLHGSSDVRSVQSSPPGFTKQVYHIHCTNADELKKELLQLSIEHDFNIVSLQSETQHLESVFKALTT